MSDEKEIRWVGSAYDDLLSFPDDWKPFDDVGVGTKEIRIRETSGIYRVMYIAKFEEAVYILHCFQKKTQATSKQDKGIAEARYRAVVNARKVQK